MRDEGRSQAKGRRKDRTDKLTKNRDVLRYSIAGRKLTEILGSKENRNGRNKEELGDRDRVTKMQTHTLVSYNHLS